jgi:GNAT superfamily N-acetyltransferase
VLVVPPWRRRGLGTGLLEHLAAQARAAGRARLFLDVGERLDGPVRAPRSFAAPSRAATACPADGPSGHRLGLWIKLADLEPLVREHPEVQAIDTFNADDNRWMIAINEAMGFVPLLRVRGWELDLTAAQAGRTAPISAAASGP